MTRKQLEHAIRAACAVSEDNEVIVFGSQAVLGQFPNAHNDLTRSHEVDIVPKNLPEAWNDIDVRLGELSDFHTAFKFYVHGVSLETANLPKGWEERCIRVRPDGAEDSIGYCLEVHDLALSKLARGDPKDTKFVRVLLREQMVSPKTLLQRLPDMQIEDSASLRMERWVSATADDLGL